MSTPEEKKEMGDLVCVKTYNNRIEAGFEMNILESEGILFLSQLMTVGGDYSALSIVLGPLEERNYWLKKKISKGRIIS